MGPRAQTGGADLGIDLEAVVRPDLGQAVLGPTPKEVAHGHTAAADAVDRLVAENEYLRTDSSSFRV